MTFDCFGLTDASVFQVSGSSACPPRRINSSTSLRIRKRIDSRKTTNHDRIERENRSNQVKTHYRLSSVCLNTRNIFFFIDFSEELSATLKELDEVKATYVKTCEDQKISEQNLNEEWESRLNVELHELRLQLISENEGHVTELQAQNEAALREAEERWRQEQEGEVLERVEAEVERRRLEWVRAHEAETEAACDLAVERSRPEVERETQERCAQEFERHIQEGTPHPSSPSFSV